MKKIFLIVAVAVCMSLAGCNKSANNENANKDYKSEAQKLASQLTELCQKQDADGVIKLDEQIRAMEKEVLATGDSTVIADFQAALREAREKAEPFIYTSKIDKGVAKESAAKDLSGDAMNGGVDVNAVANAIDEGIKKE